MADNSGEKKQERKPYYGERKVSTGNLKADQRKLRDMLRADSGKKRGAK